MPNVPRLITVIKVTSIGDHLHKATRRSPIPKTCQTVISIMNDTGFSTILRDQCMSKGTPFTPNNITGMTHILLGFLTYSETIYFKLCPTSAGDAKSNSKIMFI